MVLQSAKHKGLKSNHTSLTALERQTRMQAIHALLPQTQCQRCGFKDCEAYAYAIVDGQTQINRCQPGGKQGIQRLAEITGLSALPLSEEVGEESGRSLAVIDESWCIGCTKCRLACPVDAIMGSNKVMHTVLERYCTGCGLCIPVCPVDCMEMVPSSQQEPAPTAWNAWTQEQAQQALKRYEHHLTRQIHKKTVKNLLQKDKVPSVEVPLATPTDVFKRQFMANILQKARDRK